MSSVYQMLVERLDLSSVIRLDEDGISLIAAACNMLQQGGSVSVDKLWPGQAHDFIS